MPYIDINISNSLSHQDKENLKANLGELISIIPGKSEKVLMICINDGAAIYYGGEKKDRVAYMNVKLFKEADHAYKAAFTEQVFAFFEKAYGITGENFFLNFDEYNSWGVNGGLKD